MDGIRICIVGGSITGCTAAISALRAGMQPQVFEKSSRALKDRGAGLGIPTGVAVALRDQGFIYEGFPHVSIRSLAHSSVSSKDAYLGGHAGTVPTLLEGIRWGHLFDHLRSLVPSENYHSGTAVTNAENEGDAVRVAFDNGQVDRYDIVIFSDGYRSIGRDIVSPDDRTEYQGYFIWRGTVQESDMGDAARYEETLQRIGFANGHFFSYLLPSESGSSEVGERELNWGMFLPVPKSELAAYLVDRDGVQRELSRPPGSMRDDLEQTLKDKAKKLLPKYYAELVRRSIHTFGQGIVATVPASYRKGRICLAGDAGAVVPPFTTSGVFKGMKNAVELVTAVARGDDLETSLDRWEADQQKAGVGLKKLSSLMEAKLITSVPDFAEMSQDDLTEWWSDIQSTLEEVMG